ncbi:MAG: hypothetical protein ACRC4W_08775 [Treponemataceae bacterium]
MMKFFTFTYFAVFLLLSCSKNSSASSLPSEDFSDTSWENVDYTYHILFGYNFNDEDFIQKTIDVLTETFGTKENGGLISYSVYPTDYLAGKRTRISSLADIRETENVQGIITLGAPEGIYLPLTKMQDAGWDYPVYSLFSQENELVSQGISTFVIDSATKNEEGDEQIAINPDGVPSLLVKLIHFMKSNVTMEKKEIKQQLEKVLDEWNVSSYIDGETGLIAFNHFVIEKKQE